MVVARSPERHAAPAGAHRVILLSVPAAVCFVGWVVQATVIYPTGTRLAWATALAFVGGSFGAIIPVVVLTAQIAREPSARRWPECLMLSVSLLALVPGVLVLTALAFRR
jgi:hypothetical protein